MLPCLQVAAYLVPRMRTVVARNGQPTCLIPQLHSRPVSGGLEVAICCCKCVLSHAEMPLCAGNAQYIKYLTPVRALWFFLNAPFRARRFFDSDGALENL